MNFKEPLNLPAGVRCRFLDQEPGSLPPLATFLTKKELERRASFGHPARRHSFAIGRLVTRNLVADSLDLPVLDVPLIYGGDGAPELDGHPHELSLAHNDTAAAAVLSHEAIGVDLETIKARHPGLKKFLLHPDEYRLLDETPLEKDAFLILCWTLKEATLKAMRTGFRHSPQKLRLEIDVEAREAKIEVVAGRTWKAQFVQVGNAYLSVAYPASGTS